MQRNLATKIRAKRESGLTAVRLKWDPPVYRHISELGHIQAPDLQVSTCTTYDYRENHCKIDRLIGK